MTKPTPRHLIAGPALLTAVAAWWITTTPSGRPAPSSAAVTMTTPQALHPTPPPNRPAHPSLEPAPPPVAPPQERMTGLGFLATGTSGQAEQAADADP